MNAFKDSRPPRLPAQGEGNQEGPLIGVRLLMPEELARLFCYPGIAHGATQIMGRLLQARIEAAGCLVIGMTWSLAFHRSFYTFDLGSRHRLTALEAVRTELSALQLLDWAQIAWDDEREGIWRLYYPKNGEFSMPSQEERAAVQAQVAEAMEAVKKLQRLQDGSSGQ
jgi:hypothetical protein